MQAEERGGVRVKQTTSCPQVIPAGQLEPHSLKLGAADQALQSDELRVSMCSTQFTLKVNNMSICCYVFPAVFVSEGL